MSHEARRWEGVPPTVGGVLTESLRVVLKRLLPFWTMSALMSTPVAVVLAIVIVTNVDALRAPDPQQITEILTFYDIGTAALQGLVLQPILTGALTFGVIQHVRGRPVSTGPCMSIGLRRAPVVLLVSLLVGLCMIAGCFALLIGFFFALVVLWLAVPITIVERPGVVKALERSWELTKGFRWQILGIVLSLAVLNMLVGCLIGGAIGGAVGFSSAMSSGGDVDMGAIQVAQRVANLLIQTLLAPWTAAAAAVAYYRLRASKEGVDLDDIAAVFE